MTAHQIFAADALPLALAVALLANLLLIAIIVYSKLARERRERRAAAVAGSVINDVVSLLERECENVSLPPARHRDAAAALDAVVGVLAAVKGDSRRVLVALLEQSGYVEELVRGLRCRDAVRRSECAMLLGATHSAQGADALCDLLACDPVPEVRMIAAEALGSIGDPCSVPLIMKALAEPARFQQLRIAGVLAGMGPAALPYLERALDDPGEVPLTVVLDVLSDIGSIEDHGRVVALLQHASPEIRARAASLLGAAGVVDSVPQLAAASGDEIWYVRSRIAKALGALGVPDREPAHAACFTALEHLLHDENWYVRRNAAAALAAAGEQGAEVLRLDKSDIARAALQGRRQSGIELRAPL